MRFRVLGPLEVRLDSGRLCTFSGRKQRILLAALLLDPNRSVSVQQLVELLWDGRPPASATKNLYTYIADLRRRLSNDPGADRSLIGTHDGRYVLHMAVGDVDADIFQDLVRQARKAADEREYPLAVEHYMSALMQWHGDHVLEGLTLPPALRPEAVRLEELRTTVLEETYDARLRIGQDVELVSELEANVRKYPMRERLWGQLMLALYRSGRQADALEAYQRARSLLVGELGVDPGNDLQRLHQQVLGADPALTLAAPPARRPDSVRVRPAQLPPDLSSFTGRVQELDDLISLTTDRTQEPGPSSVLVSTIDGMAGVGKTALAVHAAHRVAGRYPDGQVFLDLHGFTEGVAPLPAADALDRALRSLGIPGEQIPQSVDERAALWRTQLTDRRMLVVLDNAADESQVRPLLPGSPNCLVIVTSRRRLAGLDDASPISLDVLTLDEAILLFMRTAGPGRLRDETEERIAEVVELCGRLPLAIRIAAARFKHRPGWTVPHLAARLRDKHNQLAELEAGQRSVASAMDVSYTHLTAEQQRIYRLLGLHPGPDIDPYAAAALTGTTVGEADQHLEDLLDAHLVQQHLPGRYIFHDLLRAHAAQTCAARDPEPVQQSALTRLFGYYAHAAATATDLAYPGKLDQASSPHPETTLPPFEDGSTAAVWLDAELKNLVATAIQAADCGRPEHILRISAVLTPHLGARALYGPAMLLHHRALEIAGETGHSIGEVNSLYSLAYTEFQIGHQQSAASHLQEALQISRAVNYRPGELRALYGLGQTFRSRSRYAEATETLEHALDLAIKLDQQALTPHILYALGDIHRVQGRRKQAIDSFEMALDIASRIGDRLGEVTALRSLGTVHRVYGSHAAAIDYCWRAFNIAVEIGDRVAELSALRGLGHSYQAQDNHEEAADCFRRSLDIARNLGHRYGELYALHGLGNVHRRQGNLAQSINSYQQALQMAIQLGDRHYQFETIHGLGHTQQALREHSEALALHRQALNLAGELCQPTDEARASYALALAHQALGQLDEARQHLHHALAIFVDLEIVQAEDLTIDALRSGVAELDQEQAG